MGYNIDGPQQIRESGIPGQHSAGSGLQDLERVCEVFKNNYRHQFVERQVIGDHHSGLPPVQSNPVRLTGQHCADPVEKVWIIDLESDAVHGFTLEGWNAP